MSLSSSPHEPQFAAFIGLDWADKGHVWALQVAGSTQRERGQLKHTPEDIESWAVEWATRFGGRPVAIALEQSRGALLWALSKYPHVVLFPVHPTTSYQYRKAMFPSGSKDDPRDADLLLDLVTLHRDRLRPLEPDTEQTRKLQSLVEKRRQLVDQRTAQTNRITDQLKLYFPQVLNWFDDLATPMVAAFLQRWPTLSQLQAEDAEQVCSFFHQHGSRSQARIEQRLQQIRNAKAPITDGAIIDPGMLMVGTLLAVVAALNTGIRALEQAIQSVSATHPDYPIFSSFPAAGPVMAPRLVAAFGTQRDRYPDVTRMASFSGIAPLQQASGRQCTVHFRWACPKFLRQTFHEYAALSIPRCAWARAFYNTQKKDRRKGHHAAVRALAFKWIRIMFRCWHTRQPYREDLYLAAREGRAVHFTRPDQPTPSRASNSRTQLSLPPCAKDEDFGLRKVGDILKSLMAQP